MKLLSMFVVGLAILVVALALNAIATKLNILTWYDFVKTPAKAGLFDFLWLFIVYPFLLGATAYLTLKLFN